MIVLASGGRKTPKNRGFASLPEWTGRKTFCLPLTRSKPRKSIVKSRNSGSSHPEETKANRLSDPPVLIFYRSGHADPPPVAHAPVDAQDLATHEAGQGQMVKGSLQQVLGRGKTHRSSRKSDTAVIRSPTLEERVNES